LSRSSVLLLSIRTLRVPPDSGLASIFHITWLGGRVMGRASGCIFEIYTEGKSLGYLPPWLTPITFHCVSHGGCQVYQRFSRLLYFIVYIHSICIEERLRVFFHSFRLCVTGPAEPISIFKYKIHLVPMSLQTFFLFPNTL
jgi:hypothetical protein